MRKQILTLACLLMATMGVNAQISKVALQHRGEVTLYDTDEIQTAINDSQDGDTIFLNEGEFPGFTVNKKIAVIGKGGSATKITSSIDINIPNTPTLTSRVLDGLYLTNRTTINSSASQLVSGGQIYISSAVNNLTIRKCSFDAIKFNGVVKNASIDRCYITNYVYLSENVVSLNVVNTNLNSVQGAGYDGVASAIFTNCRIRGEFYNSGYSSSVTGYYNVYNSSTIATFINSFVNNYYAYSSSSIYYYNTKCNYANCIVKSRSYGIYQNCWNNYSDVSGYTTAQLERDGYLGTDGTVVGEYGGTTPYTLVSTAPKITDYTLKVDTGEKKLNVNVKVTPQ